MYAHFNERSGLKAPLIADDTYDIIMKVLSQVLLRLLFCFIDIVGVVVLLDMIHCIKLRLTWVLHVGFRMLLSWTVRLFMTGTLSMITLGSRPLKGHTY